MDLISKLERKFGGWAIPNLGVYLIIFQALGVALLMGGYARQEDLFLFGSGVINQGEWWRLLSFMMLPKTMSLIWMIISFLVFYTISLSLERQWGTFRFNLFVLSGYLLTVLMSFLNPGAVISNFYFLSGVFLAFATLFPNFQFYLFFVIPVKVKWLGWLTVGMFLLTLIQPAGTEGRVFAIGNKLGIAATLINYALFFGKDFVMNLRAGRRRKAFEAERKEVAEQPLHTCAVCGATDKSDEHMYFRYCSTCGKCFCEEHIGNHDH